VLSDEVRYADVMRFSPEVVRLCATSGMTEAQQFTSPLLRKTDFIVDVNTNFVHTCFAISSRVSTAMATHDRYKNRIELLQGTLDMLILQTLQWGTQHGHGVGQAIRANSGELLHVETGSLYPALHRLEQQGWIKSEWKLSENNQRAKYYRLTAAGKKQLSSEQSRWKLLVKAITRAMKPA